MTEQWRKEKNYAEATREAYEVIEINDLDKYMNMIKWEGKEMKLSPSQKMCKRIK